MLGPQAERQAADQIKQLQEALNLAKSHIEAAQEAAEKRAAAVQAAANREVEEHRRKWRDEFEKRRKLHNIVSAGCYSHVDVVRPRFTTSTL